MGSTDLSEFTAKADPRSSGSRCWYERAKDQLDEEQIKKLDAAMASIDIQHISIFRVLVEDWGVQDVSQFQVRRHRNDGCVRCGTTGRGVRHG